MRRVVYLLPLLALAVLIPLDTRADEKDKFKLEEGFELLFNGKDLTGWKEFSGKDKASLKGKTEAFRGRFKVKEGMLVIDPSVKGDVHIETEKAFELTHDLVIKFDFKPGPKCNNDLFIFGTTFDIVPGKGATTAVKEGQWHTFEIATTQEKFSWVRHKIDGVKVFGAKITKKADMTTPVRIRAEFGSLEIKNVRMKKGS